ncbi:Cyclin-dependent kinase B1-1 [Coccomyxa sp. Obi]|nr:Cyclin-dependent kinase B1-1 [Coccomyxa sp. Obi]
MEQYEKLEKIGEGTYGKVYKARERNTGRLVALKKTRLEMEEEGVPSTALREVSLLQMLSESNHVVKLLCVQHVEEHKKPVLYLVFEFLSTDLKKYMERTGKGPENPLPPALVKSFMYQLIKGVAHCHKHGVMHRDLKPQNLLVDDSQDCLKIADLGLGRAFSVPIKSYTHEIVTLWYRAPEVLLGTTHYSPAVDMWSVACIFAELVRKVPLFPGDSELQQLLHIFKLLGTPTEAEWAGVSKLRDWHEFPNWRKQDLNKHFPTLGADGIDLMERMFAYTPSKRITARDALQHPYFDDLDKAEVDKLENEAIRVREG